MKSEAIIKGFVNDVAGSNEGRLTISIKQYPKETEKLLEFLNWMGNEFISKGGLYAVDIELGNKQGVYRVYKDNIKENKWL